MASYSFSTGDYKHTRCLYCLFAQPSSSKAGLSYYTGDPFCPDFTGTYYWSHIPSTMLSWSALASKSVWTDKICPLIDPICLSTYPLVFPGLILTLQACFLFEKLMIGSSLHFTSGLFYSEASKLNFVSLETWKMSELSWRSTWLALNNSELIRAYFKLVA